MNRFLISLILFVVGTSLGAGLIAAIPSTAVPSAPVTLQDITDSQAGWPYCNEGPALIPFFDPCPEGSHVDKDCAEKCGVTYQEEMAKIYRGACDEFYLLYLGVLIAINEAQKAEIACLSAGGNPDACHAVYKAALLKADREHGVAKEKLAKRVEEDAQKALDAYYACLLACPCLENK